MPKVGRMSRFRRISTGVLLLCATGLGASAVTPDTAQAASTPPSQKQPLTEVGTVRCNGSTPPGRSTEGFVDFRSDGNSIEAEVTLKNVLRNEKYTFILFQTAGPSCGIGREGSVTTNDQGNGSLRLSDVRKPRASGSFVSGASDFSRGFLVSGHYVFSTK